MGSNDSDKDRQRNTSGQSTTSADSLSKYIPTPPDGGWGWVIVMASFINHVIVDGVAFTFGIFYMEFLRFFKASKSETALVGSLLAGFYLMTGPIASALVNKFGCRVVCIAGSLIASLAFVLCTLSTDIRVLMLTYGVMGGFGFGLIYLPSIVSVSYYFEKKRALATGIAVCGAGVGCFIFAPAGRLMMQYFDWKNSMYIVAGVTVNSCMCGMLMRPLEPAKRRRPRKKNIFDRLKEKVLKNRGDATDGEADAMDSPSRDVMERIQEVKLAREEALRDAEDGECELNSSCVNSRVDSMKLLQQDNHKDTSTGPPGGSTIPRIIIEYPVEVSAEEDGERTKMLSIKDTAEEVQNKWNISKSNGHLPTSQLSSLPRHILNEVRAMNGHVTSFSPSRKYHQDSDPLLASTVEDSRVKPDGLVLSVNSEDAKMKSLSTANVWGLQPRPRPARVPAGVDKEDYARPLYRRDIFYSGSILHIHEFRSQPDFKQYVASITAIPTEVAPEKQGRIWKRIPLPKAAKDILRQMLDLSLLKDPVFLIACLGEIFGFIGLFVPFVFVAERAIHLGVPDTQAAFLLSVIGITNTIGRILAGWLADFPRVNALLLHNIMMILGGIACILNMFATTYISMCVFCAFFGLCVATYISLTSIILCNLMGLERLTSAFGMLTMVRGVSSIAGAPAAGLVFEMTGNYDVSFHVGGAMFIVAGSLYCVLHLPIFTARGRAMAAAARQQEKEIPRPPPVSAVVSREEILDPAEQQEVKVHDLGSSNV